MWQSSSSGGHAGTLSGVLVAVLVLIVAALLFGGIFLVVGGPVHFLALMVIGFLSLLLGAVSYFAQALSRQPTAQRAAAWGFGAFGFAVLFLSVGALPLYYSGLLTTGWQFGLLIVLVILLILPVAWGGMMARGRAQDTQREAARHEWAKTAPPSAFSYAAARDPAASPPPSNEPPHGGG